MKKYLMFVLVFVCVLTLCACGGNADKQVAESVEAQEEKVITIETPYAIICVPAIFEGNVTHEAVNDAPYTLIFKANDGTELFELVFNGTADILMGTLVGETENTVIYMNIPKLDEKNENFEVYFGYQEAVNTVMNHLADDYDFRINEVVEVENTATMDIEAAVTLKYPEKWKESVQTEITADGVRFVNNGTPLFDLMFIECDGYLLGTYKDTPIYIVEYPVANDEQAAMQEDVNVIIGHLLEDPNFALNG